MSTDHILQKFLSAENFPEWKWAFGAGSENKVRPKKKYVGFRFLLIKT